MISIEAYRIAIGCLISFCKSANHFLSGISILFSFITFSVLLLSFYDRDVESNPGQNYTAEKVVKGSYHQDDERFGDTAGVQCTCNSLFALVWYQIRQAFVWKKTALDQALVQGDLLHKSLNTYDRL